MILGTHLDPLGLTWTRLDSLGLAWTHLDSLVLTCTHLDSLGLTCTHLDSLGLTWTHLYSLGLTWTHWNQRNHRNHRNHGNHKKILLAREKGTYGLIREKGKAGGAKREKGKSATHDLAEISLDQAPRARTYARTARHETISRLRGGLPD